MTWNYRVLQTAQQDGEPWYQIHKVFYKNNVPNASTETKVGVVGESKEDLLWVLDRMREAIEKPALVWDESAGQFKDVE